MYYIYFINITLNISLFKYKMQLILHPSQKLITGYSLHFDYVKLVYYKDKVDLLSDAMLIYNHL